MSHWIIHSSDFFKNTLSFRNDTLLLCVAWKCKRVNSAVELLYFKTNITHTSVLLVYWYAELQMNILFKSQYVKRVHFETIAFLLEQMLLIGILDCFLQYFCMLCFSQYKNLRNLGFLKSTAEWKGGNQ